MPTASSALVPEFQLLFESEPQLNLVLTPALVVVAASDTYLHATGTRREEIVGRHFFEIFSEGPDSSITASIEELKASLNRVLQQHVPDKVTIQQYVVGRLSTGEIGAGMHYWRLTNSPVFHENHELAYVLHSVEDVTESIGLSRTVAFRPSQEFETRTRTDGRMLEPSSSDGQCGGEELFRNAFEHTSVAMVLTDLDHRFVRANEAFARLFGYTLPEVLTLTMMDITHPDDVAKSIEGRKRLLSGEVSHFQLEKRYVHKDGHAIWGLTNVSLIRDSQGRPYQYVGQVQDITQRKHAEQAIASYNERLRILREIDKALIAGEEATAIAEAVLPLLRDLLGVGRVVVNLFDLVTGEVEWLAAAGRRRVHVGPGVRYSIQLMGDVQALRRGEHQWIDVHTLPAGPDVDALRASGIDTYVVVPMIARGDLIGAISFGGSSAPLTTEQIDIAGEVANQFAIAIMQARLHERIERQAQQLKQQNQTLTTIIDSSPLAIMVVDVQGRVQVWNRAAEHIFGWPLSEVLGKTVPIIPLDKQDEEQTLLASEMAGTATTSLETYRLRRDGTKVDVVLSEAPLFDTRGAIIGAVRIFGDIGARKRLEEQLRQSQKMDAIGHLAGGVAHDFNNLLTVITGYSELLLFQVPAADPSREALSEIRKAGERAASLTRQLLAFSRQQAIVPRILDLNSLVTETEKMLRRLIGEDINLAVSLSPKTGLVRADPGQIEQVIMNLAVNARDAMPQGGHLTIETRNVELDAAYAREHATVRTGPYVLLAISDNGCGMNEATKARIFEPFFTTKEVGRGTGLGLATVYGIIKQSGGNIEVYSEPGHGTTFKVYLPRVIEGVRSAQSLAELHRVPTGTETILLVEDEEAVRALARVALQSNGYTVLEARDGEEALRLSEERKGPIHLLMTDVVMPQMGGRQLAEFIVAKRPTVKVLYLSGYADDAVVRHGVLGLGMAFLQKPFVPSVLARKVRAVLDG